MRVDPQRGENGFVAWPEHRLLYGAHKNTLVSPGDCVSAARGISGGGPTSGRRDGDQDEFAGKERPLVAVLQLLSHQRQDVVHAARQPAADGHVRVVGSVNPAENCGGAVSLACALAR